MPLVALPVPGTAWPMSPVVPAPISWPVTGFFAWRLVPEQVTAPPTQPGT